ncbi:hypothetical protein TTHERM_00780900 (macronuclear) [Tetrahymena thermophila SB210]|uniref:Uncharacterized protein n=1 Tax=Tetrahymena thermophila (strain SB210) TaxID=312017 RepID=I7M497_TETTS|nr:hypothetical protein TTHERM_00780900 [Tetrahymena thermophila SB210]EAS06001.1 hypothetical protein TTHERM_00780900 [Tetrahymena thermophila SB210]|eukprot:XP_001026246.1 hypothetical protein TTHERM_00780900 [Tetrahymena thermophila SB210]
MKVQRKDRLCEPFAGLFEMEIYFKVNWRYRVSQSRALRKLCLAHSLSPLSE